MLQSIAIPKNNQGANIMDARTPSPETSVSRGWRPDRCHRVALVLQAAVHLGAYQAGVYQALHESGIEPDWVYGVSIGAINSAIIAGNPPERRLERLQTFWDRITSRKVWHYTPDGDVFRKARNFASSYLTTTLGQPGFFKPHDVNPWFSLWPEQKPRPAITTRPPCAGRCWNWSISI